MKKILKNSLFAACVTAAVIFICSGCGASATKAKTEPPPPPLDEDLLKLVPESADAVLWVDMVEVRSSALFEAMKTLLGEENLPFVDPNSRFSPIDHSDEILFAFSSGKQTGADQFLILIKGTFNSAELLDDYANNHSSPEDESVSEQFGSFAGIRTPKYIIVALTDKTVAIGTEASAARVVDLAETRGVGLRKDERFKDSELGGSVAAFLRYRRGISAPDFDKYSGGTRIDVGNISGLDGTLILKEGLSAELNITAETQMEASKILRELKKTMRKLGKNMFVVLIGVDWIFDRIELLAEENTVLIKIVLGPSDLEQIKRLAERLKKLRDLTEAGEDQGDNPLRMLPPMNPDGSGSKQ